MSGQIKLLVQGTKDGNQIFFQSPELAVQEPEFENAAKDIRSIIGFPKANIPFYSIQFTDNHKVLSAFVSIYDWLNRDRGFVAFRLFVPHNKKTTSSSGALDLLDRIKDKYLQEYLNESYQIKRVRENAELFYDMIEKASLADEDNSASRRWRSSQQQTNAALQSFENKIELQHFLDDPYRSEFAQFKQVFLVDRSHIANQSFPSLTTLQVKAIVEKFGVSIRLERADDKMQISSSNYELYINNQKVLGGGADLKLKPSDMFELKVREKYYEEYKILCNAADLVTRHGFLNTGNMVHVNKTITLLKKDIPITVKNLSSSNAIQGSVHIEEYKNGSSITGEKKFSFRDTFNIESVSKNDEFHVTVQVEGFDDFSRTYKGKDLLDGANTGISLKAKKVTPALTPQPGQNGHTNGNQKGKNTLGGVGNSGKKGPLLDTTPDKKPFYLQYKKELNMGTMALLVFLLGFMTYRLFFKTDRKIEDNYYTFKVSLTNSNQADSLELKLQYSFDSKSWQDFNSTDKIKSMYLFKKDSTVQDEDSLFISVKLTSNNKSCIDSTYRYSFSSLQKTTTIELKDCQTTGGNIKPENLTIDNNNGGSDGAGGNQQTTEDPNKIKAEELIKIAKGTDFSKANKPFNDYFASDGKLFNDCKKWPHGLSMKCEDVSQRLATMRDIKNNWSNLEELKKLYETKTGLESAQRDKLYNRIIELMMKDGGIDNKEAAESMYERKH